MAEPLTLLRTVQLSALIGCNWRSLARSGELAIPGTRRYWATSKTRFECWSRWYRHLHDVDANSEAIRELRWTQMQSFYHEVISTEILTRLWAACAVLIDRSNEMRELDSYANSAFHDHLEMRRRCLKMLQQRAGMTVDQSQQLDTLRRRAERWTDLLLSPMSQFICVDDWAFDPVRVKDFSLTTSESRDPEVMGALILASLHGAMLENRSIRALHPNLNQRIVDSIMSTLDANIVDATGTFASLWETRLSNRARDVHSLITDLVNGIEPA